MQLDVLVLGHEYVAQGNAKVLPGVLKAQLNWVPPRTRFGLKIDITSAFAGRKVEGFRCCLGLFYAQQGISLSVQVPKKHKADKQG